MCRFGPYDRQVQPREDTEEACAARPCAVVRCVEQTVVELVTELLYVADPFEVQPALVAADRFAVLIEVAPAHELFHVLNVDVVRLQRIDVSE